MNKQLFSYGKEIIKKLNDYNHEAYFVGGCVRDYLLKRPIQDIDLVTSASPQTIEHIFQRTIPLGIEHGTMIVRYQGESFELTTYRYEDKLNINKPSQRQRLKNDLKYRDFTMNAIAMDKDGKIIDPFNGTDAIKKHQIKGVENPANRFSEDPLRMLRALRFVSELNFTIEQQTLNQINEQSNNIKEVAIERVTDEFTKLLKGKYVAKAFNLLVQSNIDQQLPTINKYPGIIHTLKQNIQPLQSLGEFFALCNVINPNCSIQSLVTTWKSSRKIKQIAKHLYNALIYYEQNTIDNWLVYQLTNDHLQSFVRLNDILQRNPTVTYEKLKMIYNRLPILTAKDIHINGQDLIKMFPNQNPGQWVSDLLNKIEKNIVLEKLPNQYKAIEEWVMCHPPEDN